MQAYFIDFLHQILVSNISLTVAVVTIFITVLGYYLFRDNGLPPGPFGVPVLGYWPFIKSEIVHLQLLNLKKKYGDIFSFRVTGKLYINLASYKVLREAHITKSEYFKGRTSEYNILAKILENGIVFTNGEKWQTVRRFFLSQFRERGMTIFKENTADAMNETTATLIDELKKHANRTLDILPFLDKKSNLIIRQTLFGPNTTITESEVQSIQADYKAVSMLMHSSNMVLIGRIARYFIMPFLPDYKEGLKIHNKVKNTFFRIIDDHRNTFDDDNVRDIIDSFIKEKNTRRSKGDPTAEYFTDEALAGNLLQFIGDGVNSTAAFVAFFLKALLDHPEEQEKVYKELLEVCGEDRNPGLEDKSKLTYTNAFLLEAQRTSNFVPIFPSLQCTKETVVGGYRIPKGAITLTNVYAIHNDPQVFEEPEKFNPSRFLAKEGKPKPESPITFGVGKRVCLGESYVMMQTFLFCTAIVKNFQLSYPIPKPVEMFKSWKLELCVTPRK